MRLAKQHCIYCPSDKWERVLRRVRKARTSISRVGYLCCTLAMGKEAEASAGAGERLVLTGEEQDRIRSGVEALRAAERRTFCGSGGVEAIVPLREAVHLRRLFDLENET